MDTKIFEAPVLEPTTQKFIDGLASQGRKADLRTLNR